jgi:hypothetical protein
MTKLKTAVAVFGLSAALLAAAAATASAAPVASNSTVLKAAVADDIVSVATKGKKKKVRRGPGPYYDYYDDGSWYGGVDTIGSVGHDGWGYGYNRFSGQRYFACVEDLGYGRVRPCDAGRR